MVSFVAFLADVGPRPSPLHTIGRIDNDGNYELGNVQWETRKEQQANTRQTRLLSHAGMTFCLSEWARRIGIDRNSLRERLRRHEPAKALTMPPGGQCPLEAAS